MKTFLTFFFLFFSSTVMADDISDFQIEGMSIGDSLLDYFSEEKINKNTINEFFDYDSENVFITFLTEDTNFLWFAPFMLLLITLLIFFFRKTE